MPPRGSQPHPSETGQAGEGTGMTEPLQTAPTDV